MQSSVRQMFRSPITDDKNSNHVWFSVLPAIWSAVGSLQICRTTHCSLLVILFEHLMAWRKLEHLHGLECCLIFKGRPPGVVGSLVAVSGPLIVASLILCLRLGSRIRPFIVGGYGVGLSVGGVDAGYLVAWCFWCHFSPILTIVRN